MKLAQIKDIENLDKLYKDCIENLNNKGIFQWSEVYPNIDTYKSNINQKNQFIFEENGELIGAVILNEEQADEWNEMPWEFTDGKALVIHALAISSSVQGKGYGQKVLSLCEEYGVNRGYNAIRLDAFPDNKAALYLYEKNQYEKVGEVNFSYKPVGHQRYLCYEKRIG